MSAEEAASANANGNGASSDGQPGGGLGNGQPQGEATGGGPPIPPTPQNTPSQQLQTGYNMKGVTGIQLQFPVLNAAAGSAGYKGHGSES